MLKPGKNVLIICPFARPNLGGVETHIDKLLNYAGKRGFYSVLLTYMPLTRKVAAPKFEQFDTYEIHRVPWFGNGWFTKLEAYFPLSFLYLFPGLFVKSLTYYLKNHKYITAIHAHGLAAAAITRIIILFHKKNTVVSTHAVYNFKNRKLLAFVIRQLLLGFDSVLAVSEVSRNEIIEMDVPAEKVKVHPNWVDTDLMVPHDKAQAKERLNMKEKFNILFVGRLIEKKGILLLLEAAESLPNIGFHVVGSGPEEVAVKASTNTNVHYYGVLSQDTKDQFEKLLDLYSACDYLLSPYLYDEGFSATLIESIAMGTPVIVPNRGSPPTFLGEGTAVYLSRETNVQEIVNVIKDLQANSGDMVTINKRCRDFAVEHFGLKNADIIVDCYTS